MSQKPTKLRAVEIDASGIVETLAIALEKAKAGEIVGLLMFLEYRGREFETVWASAGDAPSMVSLIGMCELAKKRFMDGHGTGPPGE